MQQGSELTGSADQEPFRATNSLLFGLVCVRASFFFESGLRRIGSALASIAQFCSPISIAWRGLDSP